MDTRVLVAIILVAGVAGGFASNYVGDYYSDDSDDVEETQTSMSEVKLGAKAPDFTVEDIEGNTFNLSDFEGDKVVILNKSGLIK